MYESFFGLARRPFSAAPEPDCYFLTHGFRAALENLRRSVERAEGVGLLVGPAGTGKTLLCQLLARGVAPAMRCAMLTHTNLESPRDLLQAILFALDLPYRGLEQQELRLALAEHLCEREPESARAAGLVLIVDEAHLLSPPLLEELRLTTNLTAEGQSLVRLLLSGQPALEELLTQPELDALNQRIGVRAYLDPLGAKDTSRYVQYRLQWAGGQPERIFTPEALDAIHQVTEGLPRHINQVADHALILAYANEVMPVDAPLIVEAWSDLQQIPTQFGETGTEWGSSTEGDVVEFGAASEKEVDWPDTDDGEDRVEFKSRGHGEEDTTIDPRATEEETDTADVYAVEPIEPEDLEATFEDGEVAAIEIGATPSGGDEPAGEPPTDTARAVPEVRPPDDDFAAQAAGDDAVPAADSTEPKITHPGTEHAQFDREEQVADRYAELDARRKGGSAASFGPRDAGEFLAPLVVNEKYPSAHSGGFSRPDEQPGQRIADEAVRAELERIGESVSDFLDLASAAQEASPPAKPQPERPASPESDSHVMRPESADDWAAAFTTNAPRQKRFARLFTHLRRG